MRFVPYLYFLRIPILFALILPLLRLWIGAEPNPMIGGFFDLTNGEVFVVCLGAFLYCAALSVAATLVLLYGRERFFAAQLTPADLAPKRLWLLTVPKAAIRPIVGFAVCVLVLIAGVVEGVDSTYWLARGLYALAALLVFIVILFLVTAAWHQTSSDKTRFIARRLT